MSHQLGFAHGCDTHAHGPGVYLTFCDLDALVRLRVRAKDLARTSGGVGHALNVPVEDLRIQKQGGCRKFLEFHVDGRRCFWTFPSAVRGSVSTRTNDRGTLNDAKADRQRDSRFRGSK